MFHKYSSVGLQGRSVPGVNEARFVSYFKRTYKDSPSWCSDALQNFEFAKTSVRLESEKRMNVKATRIDLPVGKRKPSHARKINV